MKTYKIYCKDENTFEYVFSVRDRLKGLRACVQYQLHRSDSSRWTHPNELILSVLDHGDGLKFSEKLDKDLDYAQIAELNLFLNLIRRHDTSLMDEYYFIAADALQNI